MVFMAFLNHFRPKKIHHTAQLVNNNMYTLKDAAWYTVVTLRDSCLHYHLSSLRQHYPTIPCYVVDNNAGHYDISPIAAEHNCTVLTNTDPQPIPLTVNQTQWSTHLFKSHAVLCFSADDIHVFEGQFIERALDIINTGVDIVSFATDVDAVAYMYTENYFKQVGFNVNMPGKEHTNIDLLSRVKQHYGNFHHIGEYWGPNADFWRSRYVGNPHMGRYGKDDVNAKLHQMNIKA